MKANFPKLTHVKNVFSDKKQKNNPFYYLEQVQKLDDGYLQSQLLTAVIISFNHFGVKPISVEGLPRWKNFFNSCHSQDQQPEQLPLK